MNGEIRRSLRITAALLLMGGVLGGVVGSVYADDDDVSASSVDDLGGVRQSADLGTQASSTGFIQISGDMDYGDGSLVEFPGSGAIDTGAATGGGAGSVPVNDGEVRSSSLPETNDGVVKSDVAG